MLTDLMEQWAGLERNAEAAKALADGVRKQIEEEVLRLEKTQAWGGVLAQYSKGRGTYNHQAIAEEAAVSVEVVAQHTLPKTDWTAVCASWPISIELRLKHYTAGKPYVKVKLLDVMERGELERQSQEQIPEEIFTGSGVEQVGKR